MDHLDRRGFHVHLITTAASEADVASPSVEVAYGDRRFHVTASFYPVWRGGLARQLLARLRFVLTAASEFRDNATAVLVATDIEGLLAATLRTSGARRLIYDIRDSTATKYYRLPKPGSDVLRGLECLLAPQADAIVVVDRRRLSELPHRLRTHPHVEVVENFPDDLMDAVADAGDATVERPLTVGVCGYLREERGLFVALEAARRAPQVRFTFFGKLADGIAPTVFESLPNAEYLGVLPHPEALTQMRRCDLLLALYDPRLPAHRVCAPGKVFEALMLGRPVLINRGTSLEPIVESHGAGFVIDYLDPEALPRLLEGLGPAYRERLASMGRAARHAFETHYAWSVCAPRLDVAIGYTAPDRTAP
jgi:glycosyltransferase involved in cell wall biosynthesis